MKGGTITNASVNKIPNTRLVSYDILRIIAIFAVIVIHVTAENWYGQSVDNNWLINNFVNGLVTWAVPLFATITGALLLEKNNITIKKIYTQYVPRILFCLILWHILYYFYQYPSFTITNVIQAIKNGILGVTYSHLWYLYLLLGFYIVLPILNKLVKTLDKKELLYLLTIIFITTSVIPDITQFFNINLIRIIEPYRLLNFDRYLFYFLLGYYLRKYHSNKNKVNISILILSIITLLCISTYSTIASIRKEVCIQYCSLTVITIFIIALFSSVINIAGEKQNKFINKLGELTFGVYLVHFFVEKILLKYGIHSNAVSPIIGIGIVSILITIISYTISFIISKIPFIRKTIGI